MNRVEYVNAIEDLLALQVDGAALLPSDMAGLEFDNDADVLSMTPSLMARYMAAATKISQAAVGSPETRPARHMYTVGFETPNRPDERGHGVRYSRGRVGAHVFPLDGEYVFAVRMKRGDGEVAPSSGSERRRP